MPINPITSTRLKTFLLIGHSNADGLSNLSNLVTAYPQYAPKGDPFVVGSANAGKSFWPNVYVLTSAQPFPLQTGNGNVNVPSSIADVEWLEMTASNCEYPTDPHPHASPFNYPNLRGDCWPRYMMHQWPSIDPAWASGAQNYASDVFWPTPGDTATGTWFTDTWPSVMHGVEVPLQYYWRSFWGEQVGIVKYAMPGSVLLPDDRGTYNWLYLDLFVAGSVFTPASSAYVPSAVDLTNGTKDQLQFDPSASYCYWTPADKWDWAPSTDRFYKQLYDKCVAGQAALPDGCKMDIQMVIIWMGDNDSALVSKEMLAASWENAVRNLVKRIRADIEANDWSSKPAHQIPIIWPKVFPLYVGPDDTATYSNYSFMNSVIAAVAADDPFMETIETSDLTTLSEDGEDNLTNVNANGILTHYGPTGYHEAALRIMDAFESMQVDPFDALDLDECLTVAEMKERVRGYYGKSRSQTDLADDDILLQHINAAMLSCLNHAGDNLWWLRRRMELSLDAGANTVVTMPRYVHRVLRIEAQSDVDYQLQFEQVGHADGGKLQLLIHGVGAGSYYVHFITMPKDLTTDGQKIPVPKNIAEWIAVETCRRLAASSNHTALQAHFEGESMNLRQIAMRSMAQVQRSKRDRMYTQRRPVNLRYKSGPR